MRSICFYVWNEYQLACFAPLVEFTDGYVAVEDRTYNHEFVLATQTRYQRLNRCLTIQRGGGVAELDQFDLIVAHTAFDGVGDLHSAKLAFVQYGLAKEDYNYGLWRALADVNFVFGDYSRTKLLALSNAVVVGHPVLSRWQKGLRCSLPKCSLPTLLYAPTWGEHSSLKANCCALRELAASSQYRVILAPHHNSLVFDGDLINEIPAGVKVVTSQEERLSALQQADVVVSDFSGIIFDAFYLGKKVAVIRSSEACSYSEKIGANSIEHREIRNFALSVNSLSEVPSLQVSAYPSVDWELPYYSSLISNVESGEENLIQQLLHHDFGGEYRDVRKLVRSHWRSMDAEKNRLRSEIADLQVRPRGLLDRVSAKLQRFL